jgi:hypothetical protein
MSWSTKHFTSSVHSSSPASTPLLITVADGFPLNLTAVDCIRASIFLDIASATNSSSFVNKGVSIDAERTTGVARGLNGWRSASQGARGDLYRATIVVVAAAAVVIVAAVVVVVATAVVIVATIAAIVVTTIVVVTAAVVIVATIVIVPTIVVASAGDNLELCAVVLRPTLSDRHHDYHDEISVQTSENNQDQNLPGW